jgi:hypothetical protein
MKDCSGSEKVHFGSQAQLHTTVSLMKESDND